MGTNTTSRWAPAPCSLRYCTLLDRPRLRSSSRTRWEMCRKLADFFGLKTHGSINKTPVNQSSNHHFTPWFLWFLLSPWSSLSPWKHANQFLTPSPWFWCFGPFGPCFRLPFAPLATRGRDRSNNGSKRKPKRKRNKLNKLSKCSKHKPKVWKLSCGWSLLLVGYVKVGELEIRENVLTFLLEAVWSENVTSQPWRLSQNSPRSLRGTHCANYDPLSKLEMEKTPSFVRIYRWFSQKWWANKSELLYRLDLWEAQPLFLLFKMLGWRSDVAG